MKIFSISDPGSVRSQNQDNFFASDRSVGKLPNLLLVADGMGGERAGKYASSAAVRIITDDLMRSDEPEPVKAVKCAIEDANAKIFHEGESDPDKQGMGTTAVCSVISGKHLITANVGDSRLYVSSRDGLRQITRDHSFVDELLRSGKVTETEAKNHPKKHYITRAVGAEEHIDIDFFDVELKKGDLVLLCSDGLTNMVQDYKIQEILRESGSVQDKALKLRDCAVSNGGEDNITIIIADPEF